MGKAKSSGASHKTSSSVMKKIHLRQHLRRIIKKCLKNPKCFMDISAFESWKRLGFGDLDDLGKFARTVEVHEDGTTNILEYFDSSYIKENVLSRLHIKGPVHTQKLKKEKSEKFHNRQNQRSKFENKDGVTPNPNNNKKRRDNNNHGKTIDKPVAAKKPQQQNNQKPQNKNPRPQQKQPKPAAVKKEN